jgi:hypothetical protein
MHNIYNSDLHQYTKYENSDMLCKNTVGLHLARQDTNLAARVRNDSLAKDLGCPVFRM